MRNQEYPTCFNIVRRKLYITLDLFFPLYHLPIHFVLQTPFPFQFIQVSCVMMSCLLPHIFPEYISVSYPFKNECMNVTLSNGESKPRPSTINIYYNISENGSDIFCMKSK